MCPPEKLAPHVDRLIAWLNHDEQWIRGSALNVLVGLTADEQLTGKIMSAIADVTKQKIIRAGTLSPLWRLPELLADADEKTIRQVVETLSELYRDYSAEAIDPPGGLHPTTEAGMLETIAGILAEMPDGKVALYHAASKRYPDKALPHQNIFLSADLSSTPEELQAAVGKIVKETLIPRQMAVTWNHLDAWFSGRKGAEGRSESSLFRLYDQAGITDHNWHPAGPLRNEMEWYYYSFDAPEKWVNADDTMGRFREVTFPAEVKGWHTPDFDPAKAGWKKGKAPFAAADGKPYHHWLSNPEGGGGCKVEAGFWHCGCGEPVNTLWEKEVLLLRGKFKFPEFEEGYCYRLVHGGVSHVGNGGGYRVYVNGRLFIDRPYGTNRREGGKPIGQDITREWWPEFSGKEVDLSVISFKKNHPRTGIFGGYITISMHRMKAPDMDPFIFQKVLIGQPFRSSEWQALQYPDIIQEEHEGKFVYDGTFRENKAVVGSWSSLGSVDSPDAFNGVAPPLKQKEREKWRTITFNPDGTTDDIYKWYTGNYLLDVELNIDNSQVLEMRVKTFDGKEYLFIEEGGFDEKNGPDWKCRWIVFRRSE